MGEMEIRVCAQPAAGSSPARPPKKTKQKTMRQIIVNYGIRKRLKAEGLGSYPTIREALDCRSNTEVARRIRQRALQLGGKVMVDEGAHSVQPTAKED